jgi:two-component system sensor histidine kinase HydH
MIASDANKKPEELIGLNFFEVLSHWVGTIVEKNFRLTLNDHKVRKFDAQSSISGKWYLITLYPSVDGIAVLGNNITELKKLEAALKDKERLAAIGATAGMVGHDIRNPLQAITGDLYLAKMSASSLPDSENKEAILDSIGETEKNLEYINKIVQDLQDYARPLNPNIEDTDLRLIIENLVKKNVIQNNISVTTRIAGDARKIRADSYYLNRILTNLVTNAVQAMPNGGKLAIHTSKESDYTVITVKDTGVGIPQEIQEKIFTLMFTTKSKGQGFGLPVVKRMTESLGGTVTFESQEGKGTTFRIRLPRK